MSYIQTEVSFPDKEYWKEFSLEDFENEIWLDAPEDKFGNYYQASSLGRIKTKPLSKKCKNNYLCHSNSIIKKQQINRTSYLVCGLSIKNSKTAQVQVHQFIALAFIPNPENKPCINHKNFIRTDNRVCNLEWCTKKENSQHAIEKFKRGEHSALSKLTQEDVINIFNSSESMDIICSKYLIDTHTVVRIKEKKTWKHLTKSLGEPAPFKRNSYYKIDMNIANKIRYEHKNGTKTRFLIKKYGIQKSQIQAIVNNKRWVIQSN